MAITRQRFNEILAEHGYPQKLWDYLWDTPSDPDSLAESATKDGVHEACKRCKDVLMRDFPNEDWW